MSDTKKKVLDYIKDKGNATIRDLVNELQISKQSIINHLNSLMLQGEIKKLGSAPKTFYIVAGEEKSVEAVLDSKVKKVIEENYLYIDSSGNRLDGAVGFVKFCNERKMDVQKSSQEYIAILSRYNAYKKDGYINASFKIRETFEDDELDKLLYIDFYALEKYGKTKLGQLVGAAKISGDIKLMREVIEGIKPKIVQITEKYKIDAVSFVPPTIKRDIQIMKQIEIMLDLSLPKVEIYKIKSDVTVPQKTLSKIRDRIENAKSSMLVENKGVYKNVLVIDDAVGSGATLHEIAVKMKNQGVAKKVIGLSIVGSYKGFDAINEI